MSEQGQKLKKIFGSKITLFFLLLAFIWLILSLVNIYYRKYKINKDINDLKTQIEKTEKNNQQVSAMIDYLSSQSFLEKQAREKLNMKKPGEEVVIIEPSKEPATTSSEFTAMGGGNGTQENPGAAGQEESNFVKWWRYFFK